MEFKCTWRSKLRSNLYLSCSKTGFRAWSISSYKFFSRKFIVYHVVHGPSSFKIYTLILRNTYKYEYILMKLACIESKSLQFCFVYCPRASFACKSQSCSGDSIVSSQALFTQELTQQLMLFFIKSFIYVRFPQGFQYTFSTRLDKEYLGLFPTKINMHKYTYIYIHVNIKVYICIYIFCVERLLGFCLYTLLKRRTLPHRIQFSDLP